MSRKATITLGLLVLLMLAIVSANALPPIMNSLKLGNNRLDLTIPEYPPAIGWLKKSDSILITHAPSGLSWSNVDKKNSICTLPTGTINAGDYITNCEGDIILVWRPSNSAIYESSFPITGENTDPENNDPENDPDNSADSPTIKITKPVEKSLYIRNIQLAQTQITRIVGHIDIEVEIDNPSDTEIAGVNFYIDGELKHADETGSLSWRWDEKIKGEHTIKVAAYTTSNEEICSEEIIVSILNLQLI